MCVEYLIGKQKINSVKTMSASEFAPEPERAIEQPPPNTVGESVYEAPRVRQQTGARTDTWVQPNVPSASFACVASRQTLVGEWSDAYTRYSGTERATF